MKRIATYLASAALGTGLLVANNSAWAQMGTPWAGYPYSYNYPGYGNYPYGYGNYSYGYGNYPYGYSPYRYGLAGYGPYGYGLAGALTAPFAITAGAATAPLAVAGGATAPLVTGRSVATGQMGKFCTTPAKTCELRHASYVGIGCSCHVPGGRARGSVTP
jgi:hypothetical protein